MTCTVWRPVPNVVELNVNVRPVTASKLSTYHVTAKECVSGVGTATWKA
ncbi:MAG: hypothetical protein ACM3SR_02895 [Ignavibacteriales bacterium]